MNCSVLKVYCPVESKFSLSSEAISMNCSVLKVYCPVESKFPQLYSVLSDRISKYNYYYRIKFLYTGQISHILKPQRIPIMCGGGGPYLRAILRFLL